MMDISTSNLISLTELYKYNRIMITIPNLKIMDSPFCENTICAL